MADWYAGYSEVVCTCAYKKSPLLLSGYCALLGLEEAVATDPAVGRSAVAEFVHIAAEDDVAGLAEMFVVRHEVDFEIASARGTDLLPRPRRSTSTSWSNPHVCNWTTAPCLRSGSRVTSAASPCRHPWPSSRASWA